jgi:hypothetical protein
MARAVSTKVVGHLFGVGVSPRLNLADCGNFFALNLVGKNVKCVTPKTRFFHDPKKGVMNPESNGKILATPEI